MFAEGADEIFRKLLTLIDISADLAYPAFFAVSLRLGLDVILIIGIAHGFLVAHNTGFGNTADKHTMCIKVNVFLYFKGHEGVDIFRQENKAVIGMKRFAVGEFIDITPALETEGFKNAERRFYGQTVDVHHTCLFNDVMRVILLIDADGDTVRGISHLCYGIDDQAVVLFTVIGSNDIQAISDIEQGSHIMLISGSAILGDIILTQFIGQLFDLFLAGIIKSGENFNSRIGKGEVLTAFEHFLHGFGG